MKARHLEPSALVVDAVDLAWVGVHSALPVGLHCVVVPAGFPELVADVKVLLGHA